METVTIKKDHSSEELARMFSLDEKHMVNNILNYLHEHDYLFDELEECGMSVGEIIENNGATQQGCFYNVFYTHDAEAMHHFGNLRIYHTMEDCPYCGYITETETEGHDEHTWENTRCQNPDCDYELTGEPDWDCMPGGKDWA